MTTYILRRLLLLIPTLWAIITLNFFIVQIAPGGPVEQAIATIELGHQSGFGAGGPNVASLDKGSAVPAADRQYQGGRGLDPEVIEEIKKRFGFDKPMHERYFDMLWSYARFDFGDSLFRGASVVELIKQSLPFDVWTSSLIIVGYAIPSFLFAILLIILFAGGGYLDWFPMRGLISNNFDSLSLSGKVLDYLWHIVLPVCATTIGGFATLTMLTKNSFLDEIHKQYVITARAKGLEEKRILYGHVFRNAMLLVIAGFPSAFISMFFTGSLLIEVIFSLNGLGLLGYDATLQRDYPVMFGTLYIFTLIGLVFNILSDITYTLVDPRIDFEARR